MAICDPGKLFQLCRSVLNRVLPRARDKFVAEERLRFEQAVFRLEVIEI